MYDRWSSCSMGWGTIRWRGSWISSGIIHLDVQVHDFLRVLLDVLPPGFHSLTHEDGEERVRPCSVLDCDLFQDTSVRIQRRLPKFLRVHLAKALVPLVGDAFLAELRGEVLPLFLGVGVEDFLSSLYLLQGRLCNVRVSRIDERSHVTEEQGQEKGRDVLPVDVRVRSRHDAMVSDLRQVELVPDPPSDRGDQGPDLLVLQHLVQSRLLNV